VRSKLLQKKSSGLNQSPKVVKGLQESVKDSSVPWRGRENPPGRVSPPVHAQARKDLPRLLEHGCRSVTR
jgi:hypothetical protein